MSAREAILKSAQKFEPIEVFGSKYTVRHISGAEHDTIRAWGNANPIKDGEVRFGFREMLVSLFLGDETGTRIFKDNDLEIIKGLNLNDLEAVALAGLKLNGLHSDSEKKS